MILLLDALSVKYYRYAYDPSQVKHTGHFNNRLRFLFYKILPGDLIEKIDALVILNLSETKLNSDIIKIWPKYNFLREEDNDEFITINKRIKKLLKTAKILNFDDLGLSPSDLDKRKNIDEKLNNDWMFYVKEIIKDGEVILFGEWTSQYSILLSEHLPNAKFFRRYFEPYSDGYFGIVEDDKNYIEFYRKFWSERGRNKNASTNSYLMYKKLIEDPFSNVHLTQSDYKFYFELKDPSFSTKSEVKKIIFVGNKTFIERYLYPKFKNIYYWFDCSENRFKIKPNMEGLIFTSVHKLTLPKLKELLFEISTGEYKRKTVFLLTNELPDITIKTDFQIEPVPTDIECQKYIQHFFHELTYEKLNIPFCSSQEFDSLYMDLCNSGILTDFFDSITSLSDMDLFLNKMLLDRRIKMKLLSLDFWFEFMQQFTNNKSEEIQHPVLNTKVVEDVEQYVFRRLPNKHFDIIFDFQRIYPDNPKSDGLFYIYTIIKQTAYEPIHVSTLYDLKVGTSKMITKEMILSSDDSDSFNFSIAEDDEYTLDQNFIKNLEDERAHFEEQLNKAKFVGDNGIIQNLKDDLAAVKEEIEKTKKGKSAKKKMKTLDQKRKTAIDKALKETKESFKESNPEFYQFLNENIKYNERDYSYSYRNVNNISWILDY
jgi:hypothetical protein